MDVFFNAVEGSAINSESGVIAGVSVITEGQAKGHGILVDRTTLEQVKAEAIKFKDGVKVKVNHGTGFDAIVGSLKNFRIEGNKLLADLHLLKSHEMFPRILEIADQIPSTVGLSISFSGSDQEIDGKKFARCTELYSVDFVDRPAANPSGLFNAVDSRRDCMVENKTLIDRLKEFISGVEKEPAEPVNFEARATELSQKLEAANKELSAKDAKITELTAAKTASENEAARIKTEFEAKEKNLSAEIEKQASAKALTIVAGQGVQPLKIEPAANPSETKADVSKLFGLEKVIALEKAEAAARNLKSK